jgi:hypothetical protein
VRDYDARDFVLGQLRCDAVGQRQQDGFINGTAVDVGSLVACNVGDVEDLRDGVDEVFDSEAD